ncbi:MAG: MerR family DNA-binding transcriptional regulator [Chloroflexi bacterium]|nr:MerR family DNA-binding transcriptional regulator [Chloroflexota bacterium]
MSKLAERRRALRETTTPPPAHLRRISDVAALTGVHVRTLRRWAEQELIEAQKVGPKLWYISLEDVQQVAETLKPGPKPQSKN